MSLSDKELVVNTTSLTALDGTAVSVLNITDDDISVRQILSQHSNNKASFTNQIRKWIAHFSSLAGSIRRYRCIRVTYRSNTSFFSQIVPVVLLGRFFSRELILSYRSNKAESELEDYGRGMNPFLKLFHRIEVPCKHTARVFRQHDLNTVIVPPVADNILFPWRHITQVQPRIVVARRLERGNNITGLIKAFRFVKQKYPRAELTIMGDGPQREWIEEMIQTERIQGVTLTGWVTPLEVAKQFANADMYANFSTIDGLPLSMLEAISAGLPIVTTHVGDIPSIIENRVNGLLVPINDYNSLADRIIELIEKPDLAAQLSSATGKTAFQPSQPSNTSSTS